MKSERTEVRIYSKQMALLGIIDEFSSLIWIRRYQSPGEFELQVPYSEENRSLLVAENLVQKFDGLPTIEAGVIESIEMDEDNIVVKGRFLESYLERRIIKNTTYYTGRVEASMRRIINEMVAVPLLSLGSDSGQPDTRDFQATFKTVLAIIEKNCKASSFGFRIRPDFSSRNLYFEIYKGSDLSDPAAATVVFSEKYDNIFNEQYTYDSTNYGTKCYVWQTVEDVRRSYSVGYGTGLELREFSYQTSVETDGRTEAQIKTAMEHQGELALAQRIISESFTFSTDAESPFVYREDYDVGDIVKVNHKSWGIDIAMRLTEIEEDYDRDGLSVTLTCGDAMPEIIDFEED